MSFEFIADLDAYFCEKYANYDKICMLAGFRMPKMQDTRTDEFGRTFSYTLPAETMRIALQENKAEMLAHLKQHVTDKGFSFSFRPLGVFAQIRDTFAKASFRKWAKIVFPKYGLTMENANEGVSIDAGIWQKICKGKYYPTKNLILSLALVHGISFEDTAALLSVCDATFDFTQVRDVVISYLLTKKIVNRAMREAAFNEYGVSNLFIEGDHTEV